MSLFSDPYETRDYLDLLIPRAVKSIRDDGRLREEQTRLHMNMLRPLRFLAKAPDQFPDAISHYDANVCLSHICVGYITRLRRLAGRDRCEISSPEPLYSSLLPYIETFGTVERTVACHNLIDLANSILSGDDPQTYSRNLVFSLARDSVRLKTTEATQRTVEMRRKELSSDHVPAQVNERLASVPALSRSLVQVLRSNRKTHRDLDTNLTESVKTQRAITKCCLLAGPVELPAFRKLWLAADIDFHARMYDAVPFTIDGGEAPRQLNHQLVIRLGSDALIGHMEESINELSRIYLAVRNSDERDVANSCSWHIVENHRRYHNALRICGTFTL